MHVSLWSTVWGWRGHTYAIHPTVLGKGILDQCFCYADTCHTIHLDPLYSKRGEFRAKKTDPDSDKHRTGGNSGKPHVTFHINGTTT